MLVLITIIVLSDELIQMYLCRLKHFIPSLFGVSLGITGNCEEKLEFV